MSRNGYSATSRLARLEWLLLLTAVAVVVLIYPVRLQYAMSASYPAWLQDQLEALLYFYYSPLILKGVLAGYALLGFMAIRAVRALLFPETLKLNEMSSPWPFFGGPPFWLSVLIFFGWLIASASWSVTPALGRAGAVYTAVYGAAFWVLLRRGFTMRELRTVAWLFVGLGIAALAFLVVSHSQRLLGRWVINPFDDVRNRMGTLLGHNTAAASFLMLTCFMALALLLTSTSRPRRTLLLVYLASAIMGILMMQSRAIWVLAPILGLLAGRHALRSLGWRQRRRLPTIILLMIALGLLAQLIDKPWNPLFVRDNPFIRRLHAISPQGLLDESRLRLNVIGVRLVPDAPLIGHGMYAFQYVYPRAQGKYFLDHPNSRLNRTVKYSHMAHNEYLQIWIEQGTIGLGLCCWMIYCLVRAGRRLRDELALNQSDRVLHAAFGWGALGFLLHAAFDFPFHVPQLGLPGLICLAGWAAPRQTRDVLQAGTNFAEGVRLSTDLRPRMVLRLVVACLALVFIPFAAMPLANMLMGDVLSNEGLALFSSAEDAQKKRNPLQQADFARQAIRKFEAALRYDSAAPWTENYIGIACAMLAQMHRTASQNKTLSESGRETAARDSIRLSVEALKWLNRAAAEFDHYTLHYQCALVYHELSLATELFPAQAPQSAPNYKRLYKQQLEQTLFYANNFAPAIYDLAELLARDPASDPRRVTRLRAQIYKADRGFFQNKYVTRAMGLISERRYARAAQAFEQIFAAAPPVGDWAVAAAQSYLMLGNPVRALEILGDSRKYDPDAWRAAGGALLINALAGDWIGVELELNLIRDGHPEQSARFRALELEADARLGRINYPTRYPKPAELDAEEWERLIVDARPLWLMLIQDWSAARIAFERRLTLQPQPDVFFRVLGLYLGRELKDPALVKQTMDEIRRQNSQVQLLREWPPEEVHP